MPQSGAPFLYLCSKTERNKTKENQHEQKKTKVWRACLLRLPADHRQTIIDLEEAIRLLHEAQTHIGQNDEKEGWTALFTHIWERHAWWYD